VQRPSKPPLARTANGGFSFLEVRPPFTVEKPLFLRIGFTVFHFYVPTLHSVRDTLCRARKSLNDRWALKSMATRWLCRLRGFCLVDRASMSAVPNLAVAGLKVEAVKLVTERGVSAVQAARVFDVHENALRNWVKEFGFDPVRAFPGHGQMKPEQQKIERLRREVHKLKAERDTKKRPAVRVPTAT
jgi:transposase